jgi:7-carboxy-7-deazaguanine synthase
MTVGEIIDAVRSCSLNLVEITGGEPLLQRDACTLISGLLDLDFKVLIETNGSADIGEVDRRAIIIMDVKTPGSGVSDSIRIENLSLLKKSDELKFVITNEADYDWARAVVRQFRLSEKCTVLFSPVYGKLSPAELSKWIIADKLPVRMNLQLHKYIFSPNQRGV